MKIVFVHHDGKLTGSAFSLLNMIRGFKDKVNVHVVMGDKGPYEDLLHKENIPNSVCPFIRFWTFPGPNWYNGHAYSQLQALTTNYRLRQHILALKPDLIHLNDKAAMQAGISMRRLGIPIVQHLRSSYYPTHSLLGKYASVVGIKCYADNLIAISEDETDGFTRDSRLNVIFNTVNLEDTEGAIRRRASVRRELKLGEDTLAIGFAANMSAQKGALDFLEMAIQIRTQYPDRSIMFIMAGNTPSASINQGRLARLGLRKQEHPKTQLEGFQRHPDLKDHLRVLGFQTDILGLMAAMDIMVVCTRLGVLGRQPFEAMAVKTPVVVTAGHSGNSSIVLHEKTGLVVPMKNVEALTEAVKKLIDIPSLRMEMAEAGYKYASKNFNPSINSDKVLSIYLELLSNK